MLKEREHVVARFSQVVQTGLSVAAFALACRLYNYDQHPYLLGSKEFSVYLMLVALTGWIALEYSGLHRLSRDDSYGDLFFRYLKVTAMGSGMIWLSAFVLQTAWLEPLGLLLFAVLNTALLYLFKVCLYTSMRFLRSQGYNFRMVVVVADGSSAGFLEDLLRTHDWGYRINGVISESRSLHRQFGGRLEFLDGQTDMERLITEHVVDELFYSKSRLDYEEINRLMELCANHGVTFRLRPGLTERHGMKPKFAVFNSNPTVVFSNVPADYLALKVKRGMDLLVALIALLLASPMLLLVALLIKLDDGGPVFFRQERVGLNGRRFGCLKFRTMVTDAEALKATLMAQNEQDGPVFKMKYDPRITRVGRLLRKYSIDEFPQFLNVLSGDMSVVGPRPPIPAEVQQYRNKQNRRLSMKPGITCIWQVSGRNSLDFDQWVKLDTEYIDNWSLRLDLLIILKTVKVMIKGDGM